MTAETIYAEESVNDLIGVLRSATARPRGDVGGETKALKREEVALEDSLGDLNVGDEWAKTPLRDAEPVILVAAKVSLPDTWSDLPLRWTEIHPHALTRECRVSCFVSLVPCPLSCRPPCNLCWTPGQMLIPMS
jgi:hypothetical protein